MDRHLESRRVRDVMTTRPTSIKPEMRVEGLKQLFDRHDFNSLPAVRSDGVVVGIVTKLDLLRAFRPDARRHLPDLDSVLPLSAADLMRPGIVTLEPDDPLVAAIDLMLESRLHSLPVVERFHGGPPRLVGMVSRGDLLRALMPAKRPQQMAGAAGSPVPPAGG